MTKDYQPPKNRQEAEERLEKYRRLIQERAEEVGADVARFETICLTDLWDVLESHDVLNQSRA